MENMIKLGEHLEKREDPLQYWLQSYFRHFVTMPSLMAHQWWVRVDCSHGGWWFWEFWWLKVAGAVSTPCWLVGGTSQWWSLVVLHNDDLWWHFTETTFTDFLSLFASQEVAAGKPKLSSSGDPHQLPVRPHKRFVQIYRESLSSYWSCYCCHVFLVHSSS